MPFDIFFGFLKGGDDENDPKGKNGRVPICRRDVRDLLDTGSEEEEDVGVFRELLYTKSRWRLISNGKAET
jgi:hypothetical protein